MTTDERHSQRSRTSSASDRGTILVVGLVVFTGLVLLFHALDVKLLRSDVLDYANQSRHLAARDTHLPGYPALVALARLLTFGRIADGQLMQLVCGAAWLGSVIVFDRLAHALQWSASARWAVALYALFPFVGITYAAFPISDTTFHLALVATVYALVARPAAATQGRAFFPFALAIAAMLLAHKGLWPFALLVAAVAVFERGCPPWMIVVAAFPLAAFWGYGIATGGSPLWVIARDQQVNFPSHSALPVLDGVFGTLAQGNLRGLVKGGLLLGLMGGTMVLFVIHLRRRSWLPLALVVPMLGLLALLNQWEAWASMRYARALVFPLFALPEVRRAIERLDRRRAAYPVVVALLVATQIAFAVRLDAYYEADAT